MNHFSLISERIMNLKILDLNGFELELNLNDNLLSELPNGFSHLNSLNTLWLINNNFKEIPQILGELKSLKYLFLTSGKFDDIHPSIRNKCGLSIRFYG